MDFNHTVLAWLIPPFLQTMHFIFYKLQIYYPIYLLAFSSLRLPSLAFLTLFFPLSAIAAPVVPVVGQPAPVYSLNDCLQLALERNPDILKAPKEILRTQGLVITDRSTL